MKEAFSSGMIIDLVLALMVIEGVVLALFRARNGRGLASTSLVITLASGAALMLALRAALVGAPWPIISIWMLAGLVAHVFDLRARWR